MNKKIYAGIFVFFIVVIGFMLFPELKSKDAPENSLQEDIVFIINDVQYNTYSLIEAETYYDSSECLNKQKNLAQQLDNVDIIQSKNLKRLNTYDKIGSVILNEPVLILKSDDSIIGMLIGQSACSENIISYYLCKFLKNKPEFCSGLFVTENKIKQQAHESDSKCYKCCNVVFREESVIINKQICGPTCGFINEYSADSAEITKKCIDDACESDDNDKVCCLSNNCASDGKCYNANDLYDVNSNGDKEICSNTLNGSGVWADPDISLEVCTGENLFWFNDSRNIVLFDFFRNNPGYCCGDDKKEKYTVCKGLVCKSDDQSCCLENQCVYNGKCYRSGCNQVGDNGNRTVMYCDGAMNRWYDLDTDYCEKCLGKNAWRESVCCGDDADEGKFHSNFMVNTEGSEFDMGYTQCIKKSTDCIYPYIQEPFLQGCYSFDETYDYLDGEYYCNNKVWYDVDFREKYCEECDYNWISDKNFCCGDDYNEFFITGVDGSSACCKSSTNCVNGGICSTCQNCGDGNLADAEECELPESENNKNCNQTGEICKGSKQGVRDYYGNCNAECACTDDEFSYSCIKDKCGAECNEDGTGCGSGEECNRFDCMCRKKETGRNTNPVNTLNNNCPYIIYMNFDKKEYYAGDTAYFMVRIVNKELQPMKDVKFFLEFYINGEDERMDLYSTARDGRYDTEMKIYNSTRPGSYKYIARVYHKNCTVIGGSAEAMVLTPGKKPVNSGWTTKKNIRMDDVITLTEFNPPVVLNPGFCGDDLLNIGEACEGSRACRNSSGCDYENHVYDEVEFCVDCDCLADGWSDPNGQEYCSNCVNCGDGEVNCNEECEMGDIEEEIVCENGSMYKSKKYCLDCKWEYDLSRKELIEECFCDCPVQPEDNCMDGNFVQYNLDYNLGCFERGCNTCNCGDIYYKDSNVDGVEDKCSQEICSNNFDDNDDGVVDEDECIWYYCNDCGHGLLNFCDYAECNIYAERCFFENSLFSYGLCYSCSLLSVCEDYGYQEENCRNDPCNMINCYWNNVSCCEDMDSDNICDSLDNCKTTSNHLQEDLDNDGAGDECDFCKNESGLIVPLQKNESLCDNKIDDDCDGLVDCQDKDCNKVCAMKFLNNSNSLIQNRSGNNEE
ncbi:MAG: hypothetical protein ABIC04_02565 [Nanoarchaeota archaeon]